MEGQGDGWSAGGIEKVRGGVESFFFVLVFLISLGSWKGSLKARAKVSLRSGARAEILGLCRRSWVYGRR